MHLENNDGSNTYRKNVLSRDITSIFHDHRYLNTVSSKELSWFWSCLPAVTAPSPSALWDIFPSTLSSPPIQTVSVFVPHPFSWLLQIFSNISVISKVWLASKATPSAYLTNNILMPSSRSLKVILNKNNLKTDSSAIFSSYNLTVWCLHCLPSVSQFSGQLWCSYPVLLKWFSSGQFIFSTAEN